MERWLGTTAAVALLVALAGVSARGPVAAQDVASKIDSVVRQQEPKEGFSGAILVARDGQVLFRMAYGLANREWNIPNTPDTKFRIGSLTKQFTAVLVLQLVQQKKVSLQGRLSDYLPYYRKDVGNKVTIHHLLTHTSGIPSYTSNPALVEAVLEPYPVDAFVKKYCSGDLEFEPGSKFVYSNSGYFILGAVIETVAGTSYEHALKANILDPAGMGDSGYDHPERILPKRASGYGVDGTRLFNARYQNMSIPFAAGALYSTVDDFLLWDRALYSGRLLSPEMIALMLTPHVTGDNYGYGWYVRQDDKTTPGKAVTVASHGGGITQFSTLIVRRLEERILIVLFANVNGANLGAISRGINAVLHEQRPPDPHGWPVDGRSKS